MLTLALLATLGAAGDMTMHDWMRGRLLDIPMTSNYDTGASSDYAVDLSPTKTSCQLTSTTFGADDVSFDGSADLLTCTDTASNFVFTDGADDDQPFSGAVWVTSSDPTNCYFMFKTDNAASSVDWYFYTNSSDQAGIVLRDASSGGQKGRVASASPLSPNTLYHLAFTYNGNNAHTGMNVYINGALQGVASVTTAGYVGMETSTQPVVLGLRGVTGCPMDMGQAIIWDRELTAAQVLDHYNSGRKRGQRVLGVEHSGGPIVMKPVLDGSFFDSGSLPGDPYGGYHATTVAGSATFGPDGLDCDGVDSYVSFDTANLMPSLTNGVAVVMRFTPRFDAKTAGITAALFRSGIGSAQRYGVSVADDNLIDTLWDNALLGSNDSTNAWVVNQPNTLTVYSNHDPVNGTLEVWLNGSRIRNRGSYAYGSLVDSSDLTLCANPGGGNYADMVVHSFIVYARSGNSDAAYDLNTPGDWTRSVLVGPSYNGGLVFDAPLDTTAQISSTTGRDLSPTGATCTLSGTPPTWGADGEGVDFNGTNDIASCEDNDAFTFASAPAVDTPMSACLWTNPDDATETGFFMKYAGGAREYYFETNSSDQPFVHLSTTSGSEIRATSDTAILDNVWSHICFTYDGSESENGITLYIDGSAVTSTNVEAGAYTGMTNGTAQLTFGRSWNYFMDGQIAQPKLWYREITATEVAELHADGR